MSNEIGVLTFNCMAKGYGALRGKMIGDFQVSTVLEANEYSAVFEVTNLRNDQTYHLTASNEKVLKLEKEIKIMKLQN